MLILHQKLRLRRKAKQTGKEFFTPGKAGLNNVEPELERHILPRTDEAILSPSIFSSTSKLPTCPAPYVKSFEETCMIPTLSRPIKMPWDCDCDFKLAKCGPRSSSFLQPLKTIHTI